LRSVFCQIVIEAKVIGYLIKKIIKNWDRKMPNKDGTGPRKDSTGPRDGRGRGRGRGRATGTGAGRKTGGKKGKC